MIQLHAPITAELADALETAFCELVGCSPWCIVQKDKTSPYLLDGYFENEVEGAKAWQELRAQFSRLPETPEVLPVDDHDWKNAYKAFLKPWDSRGLHWVPVWMRDTYELPQSAVCVWFDAGMAFGTGSHETTRLCAGRLLDYKEAVGNTVFANAQVIDAGCGSGILAISASLLGAKNVFGFDRDTEAARVSVENARYNLSKPDAVTFQEAGIEEALEGKSADLMVANIQADVLNIYAETLVSAIRPGGWLALSGILVREQAEVEEHFKKVCRTLWKSEALVDSRTMGEWCDVLLRRII